MVGRDGPGVLGGNAIKLGGDDGFIAINIIKVHKKKACCKKIKKIVFGKNPARLAVRFLELQGKRCFWQG